MKFVKYIFSVIFLLGIIQNISANKLWDILLLDISGDMDVYAKNKIKESVIAEHCIKSLIAVGLPDSVMFFSGGRTIVPMKDLLDKRYKFSDLRKIIGDGTAIHDALASCMEIPNKISRIVIVTNGREVGSSMSSNTLARLMRNKGICVDAIIVSAGCDSVYTPSIFGDSVLYERSEIHSGFKNIVDRTGGQIVTIEGENNIHQKIKDYSSLISKIGSKFSKVSRELNSDLTSRMLRRIKPQKINICEVDTNVVVKFKGNNYHGLYELLRISQSGTNILADYGKDDLDGCIIRPVNFVFVAESDTREEKQSILHNIKTDESYCKLRQETPLEILPMVYYSGTGGKMLLCGLDYEDAEK